MSQEYIEKNNLSNDPLDPQTVFTVTHEEIKSTGKTQCEMGKHSFEKKSENEIYCPVCQSIYIINPKEMKKYVNI